MNGIRLRGRGCVPGCSYAADESMGSVECSVVILSWNRRQFLARSLEALQEAQPSRYRVEIIVVDNGSTDGSQDLVAAQFPTVRLIANGTNVGSAEGRNIGLRAARGELILLLDNDTIVAPAQLDVLIETMRAHPEAGLVACMKVDPRRQPLYTYHIPSPASLNMWFFLVQELPLVEMGRAVKRWLHWGDPVPKEPPDLIEIPYIGGALMLVRAEAIHDVGMLDGNIFFYGEDFDWCYRFRLHGWKILYTPKVQVLSGDETTEVRTKRVSLVALRSRRYLFEKYVGRRYLPAYAAIAVAGLLPKLAYYTLRDLRGGGAPDISTWQWLRGAFRCILGRFARARPEVTPEQRRVT